MPLAHPFPAPVMTRRRRLAALAVAVVADGIEWLLGPLGWLGISQVVDVLAALVLCRLLGFHLLLLPALALEIIPVAGLLPTWIASVVAVLTPRKESPPTVDIEAKLVTPPPPPVPTEPPPL